MIIIKMDLKTIHLVLFKSLIELSWVKVKSRQSKWRLRQVKYQDGFIWLEDRDMLVNHKGWDKLAEDKGWDKSI